LIDGELVVRKGSELVFGALQMRLQPAESRINRLAAETPGILVALDCLRVGMKNVGLRPFSERRATLDAFFNSLDERPGLMLTPFTREIAVARGWLRRWHAALDGIVAKRLDPSLSAR
jgi:ATP-dependent DNA ligase